jgi:hypothetical protein
LEFSSSIYLSGLVLGIFDDTKWDVPASRSAKAASLKEQCRDLAMEIKPPTRFPIVPLASTLARAQAEAAVKDPHAQRKHSGTMHGDNFTMSSKQSPAMVVDKRGRTRAASRRQAEVDSAGSKRIQQVTEQQLRIDVKRRRRREEGGGHEKTEMVENHNEVWKDDKAQETDRVDENGAQGNNKSQEDEPLPKGC